MGQTGDTETREMRCAGCDKLCRLRLTLRNGQLEEVSGQGCGTGAEYAAKEILMESRRGGKSAKIFAWKKGKNPFPVV